MADEMKSIEEEMKIVYKFFEKVKEEKGFEIVGMDKFLRQIEDQDNNVIFKVLGSIVKEQALKISQGNFNPQTLIN